MQTHVRLRCDLGHVRDLKPDSIALVHRGGVVEGFEYRCDGCGRRFEQQAEPEIVRILLAVGVVLGPAAEGPSGDAPAPSPARMLVSLRALLDDPDAPQRLCMPAARATDPGRVQTDIRKV